MKNLKDIAYTHLFKIAQKIKYKLGISNFTTFKKKSKRFFLKVIYRQKYDVHDIINVMRSMGLKKGAVVFIHCSMTEFYNFKGTATDLIDEIISIIGEEGTLLMPAYPKKSDISKVDFDVNTSPSGAGYLSELFRKKTGVIRSINIQHSVCAYGYKAKYYVGEHQLSLTAWDKYSPYYKMSKDNALVFSFGLPNMIGTFIHCTESILKDKYKYFSLFFTKERTYSYKDYSGNIKEHRYLTHDFARKNNKNRIVKKYFEKGIIKESKVSNLHIKMVPSKYTLDKLIELADRGITIYTIPSPKSFIGEDGKFLKNK